MIAWYWALVALAAGVFIGWFFCSLAWAWASSEAENDQPRPGKYVK